MKKIIGELKTGERAMYNVHNMEIIDTTFADGESPLKECSNLIVNNCIFKWKYPFWYCENIQVSNTTWLDTARSGIWYTNNISIKDSFIEAPKQFRRCKHIKIENTLIPNAKEFLWTCEDIELKDVQAVGDYFCMNSKDIKIENFKLQGNYAFDGASNVEIRNARMNSKDSFWNCDNVTVYDSTIIGEYLGWNSKNLTFINCIIDSNQGMCYIDNIKMINCKLLNTDLCFERCDKVDANITSVIDSVKNPYSGRIHAKGIKEIILDEDIVDKTKTIIEVEE